jgi:peroxiredoxin
VYAVALCSHPRLEAQAAYGAQNNSDALQVAVTTLDGSRILLKHYAGHPLWVNFFATWCPPCLIELPDIERRYLLNKEKDLIVIGIDQQEDATTVMRFVQAQHLTFPIVTDTDGSVAESFHLQTLPSSIFIDANGTVRENHSGQIMPQDMDTALAKILTPR